MPDAVETQLPEDLKSDLAVRWFDPEWLWYAVPQQELELRYATNAEREEILEEFKRLVNEDIAGSYVALDAGYK